MTHNVFCQKLKKQAEGLDKAPFPNTLGQQIYNNISKEAWQQWLARQTMFINENRLNLLEPKAREFLMLEMKKFLFEDQDRKPEGYVPQK
ncbi:MAG: putative Fe(2+)-trafficking protein [Gammaproteobacteria bacterium]|jgi:Fe-S cluster biosynthesis and repair protein YggX|nr:putative Fe(2+)-trafficking protein [Gammaproteobacteria bacterium]